MSAEKLSLEERLDIIRKAGPVMEELAKNDKLAALLLHNAFSIQLNANDTFGYACADSVDVSVFDLPKLLEVEEKFGPDGVNAFMALVREQEVLKELQSDKYWEAAEYLYDYKPVSWVS